MNKRGFTLVEGLLTLVIVLIMLGTIGALMQTYADVVQHSDRKEISIYAAQVALDTVRQELRQTFDLILPPPSSSGDTLLVRRIDPWNPSRLPDPLPFPPPGSWRPYHPNHFMRVSFELVTALKPEDYTFYRTITYGDGSSFREVICQGLSGIEFTNNGNIVGVRASVIDDAGQVDSIELSVKLP